LLHQIFSIPIFSGFKKRQMTAFFKIILTLLPNLIRGAGDSQRKRRLFAAFIPCFILGNFFLSRAETGLARIPVEFGEVIYRCQEKNPNPLFIIGMAHRDSLTGLSNPAVSRVQAEVYKLGEWLIQNERCELLLPEGFFADPAARAGRGTERGTGEKVGCPDSSEIKTLEELLSDNRSFVNAELLLKKNHPLILRQVEDLNLYRAVSGLIRKLSNVGRNSFDFLRLKSELNYLQARRTAGMMQRIPGIIQAELNERNIKARKAIFTIGLSHLPGIIRSLDKTQFRIYSPLVDEDKSENCIADLNLKKENFGISILLPRTLAGDSKVLKITGMDEILTRYRHQPSSASFAPSR
jgi:hypothetical protein